MVERSPGSLVPKWEPVQKVTKHNRLIDVHFSFNAKIKTPNTELQSPATKKFQSLYNSMTILLYVNELWELGILLQKHIATTRLSYLLNLSGLRWLRHVAHTPDNHIPKRLLFGWLLRTRPTHVVKQWWQDTFRSMTVYGSNLLMEEGKSC